MPKNKKHSSYLKKISEPQLRDSLGLNESELLIKIWLKNSLKLLSIYQKPLSIKKLKIIFLEINKDEKYSIYEKEATLSENLYIINNLIDLPYFLLKTLKENHVIKSIKQPGKCYLHRLIIGIENDIKSNMIYHINKNSSDNKIENLILKPAIYECIKCKTINHIPIDSIDDNLNNHSCSDCKINLVESTPVRFCLYCKKIQEYEKIVCRDCDTLSFYPDMYHKFDNYGDD